VGDAEREQALQALGDHMTAGRIDINEYGERTAKVAASKTRGELTALFYDLPDPKPTFGRPAKIKPAEAAPRPRQEIRSWEQRPLPQRAYAALIPLSWIFAVVAFLLFARSPFIFAIPIIVTVIGGNLWGNDWSRDRRAWERDRRNRRRRHWDEH
jgi:hypothetical protein